MKQIKIIIERSKNLFAAYAENVEGIYGAGDTVAKEKHSIMMPLNYIKNIMKTFLQFY